MNKFAKSLLLSLVIAAPVSLSIAAVQAEAAVLGNTSTTTTDVSANTSNGEQYTVAYLHRRAIRHEHRVIRRHRRIARHHRRLIRHHRRLIRHHR